MPQVSFDDVKQQARGGWYGILTSAGIASDFLTNRHKPCPGCGGRDRFRYVDKEGNGTFVCGGGGDLLTGDGFTLIQHFTGCTPGESLKKVAEILGISGGDYRPAYQRPRYSKDDIEYAFWYYQCGLADIERSQDPVKLTACGNPNWTSDKWDDRTWNKFRAAYRLLRKVKRI
jgi:hypothetical protein